MEKNAGDNPIPCKITQLLISVTMKTRPIIVSDTDQNLTRIQEISRKLAIIIVFIGVFCWFFKIVFF